MCPIRREWSLNGRRRELKRPVGAGSAMNRSIGHVERTLVGLAATSDSEDGGAERTEVVTWLEIPDGEGDYLLFSECPPSFAEPYPGDDGRFLVHAALTLGELASQACDPALRGRRPAFPEWPSAPCLCRRPGGVATGRWTGERGGTSASACWTTGTRGA